MEPALDPTTPENVKLARWLQQLYENERVQERMRLGWVILLMLLLTFPVVIATYSVVVTLFGFSDRWGLPIVLIIQLTLFRGLVNLLRLGYFPWLLHGPVREAHEKEGGGRES